MQAAEELISKSDATSEKPCEKRPSAKRLQTDDDDDDDDDDDVDMVMHRRA